jgi:hypothetical protein
MSQKKEGKEKVPNPVLSLEEVERAKRLSGQSSSKRRRNLTAEKKFDLFVQSCRSPGRTNSLTRLGDETVEINFWRDFSSCLQGARSLQELNFKTLRNAPLLRPPFYS